MRKRSLIFIGFTVVVLGTLLVACATVPTPTDKNFQAPVVTLNSVEMPYYAGWWYYDVKVKPTKGDAGKYGAPLPLAFVFDIQNPNEYPVMMDGLKFTVAFDGIRLVEPAGDRRIQAQGKRDERVGPTREMVARRTGVLSCNRRLDERGQLHRKIRSGIILKRRGHAQGHF
jgi:hypothetical protein